MKISVIVATFNSASTVSDTLESILRQTWTDYEVVVKDGLSKDDTVRIVESFRPRFGDRLKVISDRDGGIYYAMNEGISAASGDIVGILNSDDFYTSDDALETIAAAFGDDPSLDAVYGDIHYVRPEDLSTPVRYYSSAKFRRERMLRGYMPAHPSFYVRRRCYLEYGLFDPTYKVAADFENLLNLIYVNGISTRYIPKDFVTMRLGGASSSGLSSYTRIINDHMRAYRTHGIRINRIAYYSRFLEKLLEFHR